LFRRLVERGESRFLGRAARQWTRMGADRTRGERRRNAGHDGEKYRNVAGKSPVSSAVDRGRVSRPRIGQTPASFRLPRDADRVARRDHRDNGRRLRREPPAIAPAQTRCSPPATDRFRSSGAASISHPNVAGAECRAKRKIDGQFGLSALSGYGYPTSWTKWERLANAGQLPIVVSSMCATAGDRRSNCPSAPKM
jgi:hypothetical protein